MTKEELVIIDKFNQIKEQINNLIAKEPAYVQLYECKEEQEENFQKLKLIFFYIHCQLNFYLDKFNGRVLNSKYYLAEDSRQLIILIDMVLELQNSLNNSNYYFLINRTYYFYIKKIRELLKPSGGSIISDDIKTLKLIKYERIFNLQSINLSINEDVGHIFKIVSTRNAEFEQMPVDEKLSNLNMVIEYILNEKKKYKNIDSTKLFLDLIDNDVIKQYRNKTHCFRHGSKDAIEERKKINNDQKDFLIDYGVTICKVINKYYN